VIIADTGPLYALIDRNDTWHRRVKAWWGEQPRSIVVPVSVLPEVCYLLQTRISAAAEHAFVRAVTDGVFVTEPLEPEDLTRAAALMQQYADLPLGFVDAAVIATAERLGAREILTTNRRHFGVVSPRHVATLSLVP
jgi:uncharacterized protein